jgi:hypothetical protein
MVAPAFFLTSPETGTTYHVYVHAPAAAVRMFS